MLYVLWFMRGIPAEKGWQWPPASWLLSQPATSSHTACLRTGIPQALSHHVPSHVLLPWPCILSLYLSTQGPPFILDTQAVFCGLPWTLLNTVPPKALCTHLQSWYHDIMRVCSRICVLYHSVSSVSPAKFLKYSEFEIKFFWENNIFPFSPYPKNLPLYNSNSWNSIHYLKNQKLFSIALTLFTVQRNPCATI